MRKFILVFILSLNLFGANELKFKSLIGEFTQMISFLSRVEEIDFVTEPLKGAVSTVYDGMIIMIPLAIAISAI